jgi:pilus assembly protein CpaE
MRKVIPGALISTDAGFRALLVQLLSEPGRGIALGAEISLPFIEVGDEQLRRLRDVKPELIFIDLEKDPLIGIKFAQFLGEQQPNRQFIAVGPVLAPETLLEAMRAGITEYLPKPVTREALIAALERMEKKLGVATAGAGREPGKVLTFFSAKGGSGATAVAANLAIQLHQLTGKRTLLIDLDLELGEIASLLGVQPRFNLVDLVRNFHRMDAELLASYIERHGSGVHLLSAPYHPEKVESVSGEQIRAILHFLKQHYDFVVVDTPRTFSPATLAAFEQADEVFLVANVDLPSLRNIKRTLPLLDRFTGGQAVERVRLLINRHDPSRDEITTEEIERTLGMKIFWRLTNDYENVMRSINAGEPVVVNGRNSPFARDIRAMASEMAGIGPASNGKRGPFMGLLRFFGGAKEVAHG